MTTLRVQYTVDGSGNVVKSFRDIGQAVDQTTGQVRALTQEERKLVDELDRAGARKRALAERMNALDDAFRKGIISQSEFRRGTVAAIKDFVNFDRILGVVAGAATAAAGAVIGITAAAINNADRIDELSQRLSISSETLSVWGYAAKQTGTDLETIASLVPKLSKNIADAQDPTSKAAKIFKLFGIDVRDTVTGQLRSAEKILPELADAFKALNNPVTEQALALELFGRNGAEVLEFLNLGGQGLSDMETRARALGIVLSDEATSNAAAFKDELANLQAATLGLGSQIAAQLLPSLSETVSRLAALVSNGQLASNITTLLSGSLSAAIGVLEGYNRAVSIAQLTTEVLVSAVYGLNDEMRALATLNFDKIGDGFAKIAAGYQGAQSRLDELRNPTIGASKKPVFITGGSDSGSIPETAFRMTLREAQLEKQVDQLRAEIDKLLGGGGGKGNNGRRSGGKSPLTEEQREAERLARQYASLTEKQRERLATLQEEIETGEKVGSAWKLAYDIQTTSLAKLSAGQRLQMLLREEEIEQLERRQKAEEKAQRERERAEERARDLLASLREELETLGMTNEQLEIYNNLKRAGVDANSEFGRSIVQQTQIIQATRQITDALDGLRGIGYEFLVDLPRNGAEAWKKLLSDLESMLLQWAAKGIIEQVFGQAGTTGKGTPGGDLFGSLFGGLFGGGGEGGNPFGGIFNSLLGLFGGGRADGGAVYGGQFGKLYDINERGLPELLRFGGRQMLMMPPGAAGVVSPTGPGPGRAMHQTNHFHLGAPTDRRTQGQIAARLGYEARRALERDS